MAQLALGSSSSAAPATCATLSTFDVARGDEAVVWGRAIAEALIDADVRVSATPDRPALSFVLHGPSLSPGAWYCPSGDTIFISEELARWAWQGRASDGADFLGFVVAHELAHRRYDERGRVVSALGVTHALTPGAKCPDLDEVGPEVKADHRAAFLLGIAKNPHAERGFSPFNLTRRDGLKAFLSQELGWQSECPALDARVKSVEAATARMRELGEFYETAIILALAPSDGPRGPRRLGLEVLEKLSKETRGTGWDAVPEVDLMRAVMHLDRAQRAGWCPAHLKAAALTPDPCASKCAPVFPRHAGLSPYDAVGKRDGEGSSRAEEIAAAKSLVEQAKRAGLPPDRALGVEACLAYADAKPARGLALLKRVQSQPLWRTTVALLELQQRLLEASDPVEEFHRTQLFALVDRPRVPEVPLAGGPAVAHPRGACGGGAGYELGGGWTLEVNPLCRRVVSGGRGIELSEQTFDGTVEAWMAGCDVYGPGISDDGASVYGARCNGFDVGVDDGWVLFERGGRLERVVRLRNF
jgi:hypothetical protein